MILLSIGKLRGLQSIATSTGTFTVLALDHRQNLRKANPAFQDPAQLAGFKLEVTQALAPHASAILLDPEVSAAQAISAQILPKETGLVVAVEATGYTGAPTARQAQIIPGWSVSKARRMGANAVKLLVYFHPEAPTAAEIEAFVAAVAQECDCQDLALMLEPLAYSPDETRKLNSAEKRAVVVETARRLTPLGVDVLKAEFPLDIYETPDEADWLAACREVSAASQVPWILLSAAAEYDTYLRQVTVACQAGASGVAVGRAVWQEAVHLPGGQRKEFLATVASQRLARLNALCQALAKPYTDFYTAEAPLSWYRDYSPGR